MVVMTSTTTIEDRGPGPPWYRAPGVLLRLRKSPLEECLRLRREFGDLVHFRFAQAHVFLVSHPDAIARILRDNAEGYSKRAREYEAMKPVLGEGLLTSDGEHWKRQRRTMQPAFRHKELGRLVELMTAETEARLSGWREVARDNHAFDVSREMTRLTLTIVGKALFRTDLSGDADSIGRAVALLNRHMAEDSVLLFELPHWIPTARNRSFRRAKETVDARLRELACAARASDGNGHDLLSLMSSARDPETGEAMSATELRDEIITLLAAGHETTASALSWTFHLLSQHPGVADALAAEADRVFGDPPPRLEDLAELRYARSVLEESMRLFPPAWGVARRAERTDEIAGRRIPQGSIMEIFLYATHRHPDFWERPDEFEPDRFLPERAAPRHRFAYLPFGAGPRVCIGKEFALMEATVVLAMAAQRFRFAPAPGHPIDLEPLITLRPRYGVWLKLKDR
jgi:cytochrome P450